MSKPEDKKPPLTEDERNAIERRYVFLNYVELAQNPVRGNFDADHLKEIHRRLFKDLPEKGLDHWKPGEFREPPPPGRDWIKNRPLETVPVSSTVAYSRMDGEAKQRLDAALKTANPAELSKHKTAGFAKDVANLYTELDYIHPFKDGNSRTLRTFTQQLAKESGYELNWERYNESAKGRDFLYIVRDKAVNNLALPKMADQSAKREVVFSMDQLQVPMNMNDAMAEIIRPSRAVAFEKADERQALNDFPELATAYSTMQQAEKYYSSRLAGKDYSKPLAGVRARIQQQLDAGETTNLYTGSRKLQEQHRPQAEVGKSGKTVSAQNKEPSQERDDDRGR